MRAIGSAVASVLLLSASAWAQAPVFPLFDSPALIGKPYSAEIRTAKERTLADGTHIRNEEVRSEARDSEGRTYMRSVGKLRDQTYRIVIINDPVAHEMITLNGWSKTAEIQHTVSPKSFPALTPEQKAAREARIQAVAVQTANIPKPTMPHAENLGTQSILGIYVQGFRHTRTIPVGEMGNDRELKRVDESWFSSDLNIQMESTINDPMADKTTTKVTSIDRGDPDPALFRIPDGYKVVDKNPEAATAQP
jgi:hypothetical protein